MPKEFLEIVITADNAKAIAELNEMGEKVKSFERLLQKSTDPTILQRLQKALSETKAKMEVLNNSIAPLGKNTENFAKGSNQAAQALTNVGRVAQDLPFGFMGIQNNLNPLLESFQRLKAESGSTSGALKALGASMLGAGGLGLAVSIASSAFLLFGDRLFDSKKKTEEAKTEIDNYRRSLLEANKEAAQSIKTVANLIAADSLQTTSLKQKQKIIEELQGISKEYFGNLTIEKGEITGLANAYQLYADNIFRVAEAKLASKKIEELGAKLAEVTRLSNNLNNAFMQGGKQAFINPAKSLKELEKLTSGSYFESIQNVQRIVQLTGKSEKQVLDYLGEKNLLRTQELQLSGQIYGFALKTARVEGNKGINGVKEDKVKESPLAKLAEQYKADIRSLVQMLMEGGMSFSEFRKELDKLNVDTLKNFFKQGGDAASEFGRELISLQPAFNEFGKVIERGQVIRSEKKNTQTPGLVGVQKLEDKGLKKDQLAEPVNNLNGALMQTEQIMSVIGPQIDNLFTALEKGTSIGEAVGDMFKNLAADIAKAAIKAAVFSAILSVVSGGASTAAGGGGFFKIFGKLLGGGFAKGGVSYGPQGGHMELLHGTEAVLTPAQMSGLVRNSMNAGAIQSMGSNGGQDMNISGEFVARGQDLVLALQRSNYSLNLRRG